MDANSGKVIQSFPISAGVEANVFESSTLLSMALTPHSIAQPKPPMGKTSDSAAELQRFDSTFARHLSMSCTWQYRPSSSAQGSTFLPVSTL
jgi:hypothetical protein